MDPKLSKIAEIGTWCLPSSAAATWFPPQLLPRVEGSSGAIYSRRVGWTAAERPRNQSGKISLYEQKGIAKGTFSLVFLSCCSLSHSAAYEVVWGAPTTAGGVQSPVPWKRWVPLRGCSWTGIQLVWGCQWTYEQQPLLPRLMASPFWNSRNFKTEFKIKTA